MATDWEEALPAEEFKKQRRKKSELSTEQTTDQLPPYSTEAEQGVLGCILLDPKESMPACIERLEDGPMAFYELRHRAIYERMCEMHKADKPIDVITLQQALKDRNELEAVGGIVYLSSLNDATPSASNLDYYLPIIIEKHLLRKVQILCIETASRIQGTRNPDELVVQLQRDVANLTRHITRHEITSKECAERFVDDFRSRVDLNGQPSGIHTGLCDYDRFTDGLQLGEQVIIGARPSQGKTALGLTLINNICLQRGVPALFISLEMTIEALMRRLIAINQRIGMRALRTGQLNSDDVRKVPSFVSAFKDKPLTILDYSTGAGANMVSAAISKAAGNGAKLVVIDYLQKIKAATKNEKRTYEVAEVSGILRAAAVKNKVAMVTLAQLNREPDKGGKNGKPRLPRISDLSDSAQIERDADVIGLLHRESMESPASYLYIGKSRDGECGLCSLHFNGIYCQFTNGTTNQTPQI
jgi:replicative DNA helicase